eukprot:scaffold51828_cov42-Prasinocladus_malaysianus.AAC.2
MDCCRPLGCSERKGSNLARHSLRAGPVRRSPGLGADGSVELVAISSAFIVCKAQHNPRPSRQG